jgi:hypothetical protein
MPTYTFTNTETNETFDKFLSLAEREEFLKNNPHMKQNLTTPAIGDPMRLGVTKTADGFNDLLKNAKKENLHSTIETR